MRCRLTPDLAEARNNLGVIHQSQGEFDEAEACFREALRLEPDYAEAHNNLGNVLQDQGRFEEAVPAYRRALQLPASLRRGPQAPGQCPAGAGAADVKRSNATTRGFASTPATSCCTRRGPWSGSRWAIWCRASPSANGGSTGRTCRSTGSTQPVWDGTPLDGRTILICTEQGLGDSLQFIRYATRVARAGGRVVVACPPILARILRSCPGVDEVVSEGSSLPEFDCYAPVMSLARILGTTLETIPAEVPYLSAEPACVERWRAELGRRS